MSFLELLKATVRLEAQWEPTRVEGWEEEAVPNLDRDRKPMRDFVATIPMKVARH
ncbi:MAG TPA: hypothetical protein VIL30_25640 [Ramlibacter sp.]|jgi:hypothetical protein